MRSARSEGGLTLAELLVVVALVAVLAGLALPPLARGARLRVIRAAALQLDADLTAARSRAVVRNTRFGVSFVVTEPGAYRIVSEDDLTPDPGTGRLSGSRVPLEEALRDAVQAGPVRRLPAGVAFGTACPGFTPNDAGFRFDRLGRWCDPSGPGGPCPAFPEALLTAGTRLVANGADGLPGGRLCLVREGTGLHRLVSVSTGGRVRSE